MTRATRPLLIVPVLVIAALTLAGCSSAASSSAPALSSRGGSTQSEVLSPGAAGSSAAPANNAASATADRSVVVTGTVTVTAARPLDAADRAIAIVEAVGGRIDGRTETAATSGDAGSATLVLRIPAAKLTPTLDALKKLGRADQVQIDASDVTAQTQDLGARIDALRASITRLLQLESTATDTTNLIAIETAVSDRQGELESLEAQQRGLDDQISMSTITLDLRSAAAAPPVKPANFLSGLSTGWAAFIGFWAGALVVLGVLLPWLALAGLGVAGVLLVRRAIRRRGTRSLTPPAPIG
jgi:hypothetical protein